MWALPELVEAAARVGDAELAREALKRLEETTQPSGVDIALGIQARSRALLTNGDDADRLYREAIERLGRTQVRPELARGAAVWGEGAQAQPRDPRGAHGPGGADRPALPRRPVEPEIGAQLFLSARTVEWDLRKVFTKLGISSRRQLRAALPDGGRLR